MPDFQPGNVNKRKFFQAKFESKCMICQVEIYEGEFVSYSKNDQYQVICKPCASEEDES